MELYEVMRTTFAARQFTDEEVPDSVIRKILDNARFAASGGNHGAAVAFAAGKSSWCATMPPAPPCRT